MTHYGQENARLSRDQLILNLPEVQEGRMFTLKSRMLFNIPRDYNTSLEKLWADEIVYQGEWRDFIPKCRDEWIFYTVLVSCMFLIWHSAHIYSGAISSQTVPRAPLVSVRMIQALRLLTAYAISSCNLVILNSFHGSVALAKISTSLSTAAVTVGTVLLTQHQNSGRWTAAYAVRTWLNPRSSF